MPKPLTPRPFALRKSAIAGRGAFATRRIPKGACIIEYRGERIGQDEADRRYPENPNTPHHTFLFTLDEDTVIDAAVKGNAARFINHSCDPNCEAVIEDGRIWIYALKNIPEGAELLYDYQFILDEPHTPAAKRRYPCHCGAKNCRGTILAKKR
ncbi:MAG TPA: SET domain-containing protein-lysine N-methyltransferase [Gemmatimonadaceae bacterium]|nr:SET domain-containing protein-lysine N-methyltransferase [Gemmatimonadaceae bacterium]